jgi:broad specificity phosphatase PhoE
VSTRLVLVCHAATAATRAAAFPADEPLDEHGLADAAACDGALRRVESVSCGPALRCAQTAAALGLAATPDPALADCDLGRWQGRAYDEVAAAEPDAIAAWLTDPAAAPHGGESVDDVLTRARAWLRALPPTTGTVVAVTHPAVIRAMIIDAIAATSTSFWRIDVTPLTQTVLRGGGARWTLRATGLLLRTADSASVD